MENKEALHAINEIRTLMNRSSKFLSLSGLSAILVGVYTLLFSVLAYNVWGNTQYINGFELPYLEVNTPAKLRTILYMALILLVLSLCTTALNSYIKGRKMGEKMILDKPARRFLFHFFLPLFVGGVVCLSMIVKQHYGLTSSIMLIFYGLALVNASSYTVSHTRYLGYFEILLGLVNSFVYGAGFLFWIVGFGVAHIVYGVIFWLKYERNNATRVRAKYDE